eukprot:161914_1
MSFSIVYDTPSIVKRCKVNITPNTSFKSVCVDACKKFKLDSSCSFRLKDPKKRLIDESLTVRFANIPRGSVLSLVRIGGVSTTSKPATIVLQLSENDRHRMKSQVSATLWDVLLQCERELNMDGREQPLNITDWHSVPESEVAGKLEITYNVTGYMQPVLTFMHREIANSNDKLKSTSLSDLGISSASPPSLLKLKHRYTPPKVSSEDETKIQNMFIKKMTEAMQNAESPAQTVQNNEIVPSGSILTTDRCLRILRAPLGHFDPKLFDVPDEFFECTAADFAQHKQSIRDSFRSENVPDPKRLRHSSKMANEFELTTIRIRLPNRIYLEGKFHVSETISDLLNFTKGCLENHEDVFTLFIAPPRQDISSNPGDSFSKLRLVPAAIVNFSGSGSSDGESLIRSDLRGQILDLRPVFSEVDGDVNRESSTENRDSQTTSS